MRIYWYAPFDNACERDTAAYVCRPGDELTFHSLSTRFGRPLSAVSGAVDLVRNLREPAGESGPRATPVRRAKVALQRSLRRELCLWGSKYDLLHIHTFNMFTDWVALPALRRKRAPLVLSVHNVLPHVRRGPDSAERLLHRVGYAAAEGIVVAHDVLANQLVEDFGVERSRISVVPLAVPVLRRTQERPNRDPKEILFFGTIRSNKGIPVLLEAIRGLPRELHLRFRFAGRGEPELESLIARAAEQDGRIIAELGWVTPERQAQLYSQAWAIVLPYTSFAAQSGVLREGYSFGVPAIASDLGALGRAVRDERTGWLVRPSDPRTLADAIVHVTREDAERSDFAARALKIGESRSPRSTASELRELYGRIVESIHRA